MTDKVTLISKRAELVESLAKPQLPEERVRIQGELSIVNAQIKALNTTEAAQLKAAADRRKAAGLAEAQANAVRARAKIGMPNVEDADPDPAQTKAIDNWIVAVLKRGGLQVRRASDGNLDLMDVPAKWVAIISALCDGIYAAARGEELPEVTVAPKETKAKKRP